MQPEPASAAELEPAKTRGFLFADLRGYTRFADSQGDRAAADLLGRFRPIVREAVARAGGAEIRTEGDSFFVVFDSVSGAVRCGLEILDGAAASGAAGHQIDVGVGVHAGEALPTGEGLVGVTINIASRLCGLAAPGELIVSDTVRALTRTYLGVGFEPLGPRRLKGVQEQVAVYRVLPEASSASSRHRVRVPGGRVSGRLAAGLAASVALVVVLLIASASLVSGLGATSGDKGSMATSIGPNLTAAQPTVTSVASAIAPLPTAAAGAASNDPFPNLAETALLSTMHLLPATVTAACERGTYAVLAGYDGRAIPLASVTCRPQSGTGASTFLIRRFGAYGESGGPADYGVSVIGNIAAGKATRSDDILPGDCATSSRAAGRWEIPTVASGSLICYVEADTGDAMLWWTYDDASLIVRITSQRGDTAALYKFFDRYKGMITP